MKLITNFSPETLEWFNKKSHLTRIMLGDKKKEKQASEILMFPINSHLNMLMMGFIQVWRKRKKMPSALAASK